MIAAIDPRVNISQVQRYPVKMLPVALFDMPNSNRFDILSISIFSEISLSISIFSEISLSIAIFSKISFSISIFSRSALSISISISIFPE